MGRPRSACESSETWVVTFAIVTLFVSLLALCWQVYAIGRRVIGLEVRATGVVGGGESSSRRGEHDRR